MKEIHVFNTKREPDFLVGALKSWCFYEVQEGFERDAEDFMEAMREYLPEADYPFIALLTDVIAGTNTLCFIRPDSPMLSSLRGRLEKWSLEYDASTSEGLARMIDEDTTRPDSPYPHMKPSTCVVSFLGDHHIVQKALQLLSDEYGYEVKEVVLE